MSQPLRVAGFEVITSGRFWVITKDRAVDQHACRRLRQWLRAKHKVAGPATRRFSDEVLHDTFGLARLTERTRSFSWAKP